LNKYFEACGFKKLSFVFLIILFFFAKNKIFGTAAYAETEHSHGIGIENTKRRLELLYPNKYTLSITKEENFEVLLKINLNEN